mgnify:FL=1
MNDCFVPHIPYGISNHITSYWGLNFQRYLFPDVNQALGVDQNGTQLTGFDWWGTYVTMANAGQLILSEPDNRFWEIGDYRASKEYEDLMNSIPNDIYNTLSASFDTSYINDPVRNYPANFGGDYIKDLEDGIQFGYYSEPFSIALGYTIDETLKYGFHPTGSSTPYYRGDSNHFIVKQWKKKHVHSRKGEYRRSDNIRNDNYTSSFVYTYNLIVVPQSLYSQIVYTSSYVTSNDPRTTNPNTVVDMEISAAVAAGTFVPLPGGVIQVTNIDYDGTTVDGAFGNPPEDYVYTHNPMTLVKTPNETNGSSIIKAVVPISPFDGKWLYRRDNNIEADIYYEVFTGYPRNHHTNKRQVFSKDRYVKFVNFAITGSAFTRGKQTADTTVGNDGLGDNSTPVTSINTSNVNVIKSENVLNG